MADPGAFDLSDLPALALRVREHCLRMASGGGCFIGASLSCADLLVHLYSRVLRVRPDTVRDPSRDYLLLSKGHDVPALYATLAELGFFPRGRLGNHLKPTDSLYWHPSPALPGVEFHSGSLGHLLAVGLGIALDIRLRDGANRVFVLLGDGELDEGSVWEAALVAAGQGLDNLVAIVDRNGFQANGRTEEILPLEPLLDKWKAFGWAGRSVDGHSFAEMDDAFETLPLVPGRPTVVLARTVRGKGVPSLEERADRWFADFTADEVQALVHELRGRGGATLVTPGTTVR
jgi:transketolase